jgi:hypothetical protein
MTKYDIYLIWGKDCDGNILRYYGSTANFIKRKSQHKYKYNWWVKAGRPNNKKCSSVHILDNGDWRMEKIDEVIGERWEAKKKEGDYIKNNECVNVRIENRTKKEYKDDHKEKITEYQKQYRADNKDKIEQYYNDNKDKVLEYQKQYHNDNKEQIAKKKKEYYKVNKDKIAQYYIDNKNKLLEKKKEKITCECGSKIRRDTISRHRESKKHINLISNNEKNV